MIRLAKLLRLGEDRSQRESLRSSVGECRGPVQKGRYTCWEAVGPVRDAWSTLGPEIKDFVDISCKYCSDLCVEIYMIGRAQDTAAPTILICSQDLIARRRVRKAIKESGIMDNHPTIGLGDTAKLPDLLGQEDVNRSFPLNTHSGDEIAVLSPPRDKAFGRRLFIPRLDGDLLRPATAGPILHISDKIYQLTVGHAFFEVSHVTPRGEGSSSLDDCDFDGQSDSEEDASCTAHKTTDKANSTLRDIRVDDNSPPSINLISTRQQDCSFPGPNILLDTINKACLSSNEDFSARSVSAGNRNTPQVIPAAPRRLDRIGKLALISETGTKQSLDYGLVELQGDYRYSINEIACGPNSSQRWLRVREVAKVGPRSVNIVTVTSSCGFLSGKLSATASYMRLHNQRTLQELYYVRLDGKLVDGDCGSAVVDQDAGYLYGHIVAGTPGTGLAYIVPAMQVFDDISDRLEADITLVSPGKLEPRRVVEFASERYFNQLKQPDQPDEDKSNASQTVNTTTTSDGPFILPLGYQVYGTQGERATDGVLCAPQRYSSLRRPRFISRSRPKISAYKSKTVTHNVGHKRKDKEDYHLGQWKTSVIRMRNPKKTMDEASSSTFEDRFFALPSDLQVQIIASLCLPDVLNLRVASRSWHNLISLNEAPISRAFIDYNHLPDFAICLYPLPNPLQINFHYVYGLWHRLSAASKLSTIMTEWITKDYFLRSVEAQRFEFLPQQARMHRRLFPLLFTIFHFFETYRDLHLKHVLKHGHGLIRGAGSINPLELQIMEMYDNKTLLQVHQIFPLVVSSFCRTLRPPSYLDFLEKPIRGYHKDPPSDQAQVAVLCIGGLKEVARISEIEAYDLRATAVDRWYNSISQEPIKFKSQVHHRLFELSQEQSKGVSFSTASPDSTTKSNHNNSSSRSGDVPPLSGQEDDCNGLKTLSSGVGLVNTSLRAGPPMGPLTTENARLLLSDLPTLQQIWIPTCEALLLAKRVVEREQDIKRNAQVLHELISEGITDADDLFYKRYALDNEES